MFTIFRFLTRFASSSTPFPPSLGSNRIPTIPDLSQIPTQMQ